jgi:uncharacterized membrane protein YvlD (DUF360 family)
MLPPDRWAEMTATHGPTTAVHQATRSRARAILHVVRWMIGEALLQGAVLIVLAWLIPGFIIGGPASVVLAAVGFVLVQAAAWPFIYELSARLHPLVFPIISLALNAFLLVLFTDLVSELGLGHVHVSGPWIAALIVVALTIGSTLLGALFSLRDDDAYDWFVTRPLRRKYADTETSDVPGILFLEIDGLAEPILRQAIHGGWMPTVARWVSSGSHTITGWEPDLSSQTSASQAGILLGDNIGIPAFRWYDKREGKLMVSSSMSTARVLEEQLSREIGLLRGGGSRWNVFSGDAADSVCTYSTFGDRSRPGSGSYLAYFANPYTLPRAIALYFGDVIREWWQAAWQAGRNVRPRIRRGIRYAFIRAATTTLMQEAALFMLLSDIYRGVPVVYVTLFAYDEVAHHSGIDRPDAFKVLATIDRAIAILEKAIATAPRRYHLVLLSDHGQSMGPTFRQQYGQTLGELVTGLIEPGARITIDHRAAEDWGHVNVAITEALRVGADRRTARLVRRALDRTMVEGETTLRPAGQARTIDLAGEAETSDVVVLASGNLGLISFPKLPGRLTYEQIVDKFPALIPGLIGHEGIGFVLVRSATEGGLVIGGRGIRYLDHGYATGEDPLAPYGPKAEQHLKRTDTFANVPDILVMSPYDPATGEVFAFEELVGSHGGLGGTQTRPFVLHSVELDAGPEPIIGAMALNHVLEHWRTAIGQELNG